MLIHPLDIFKRSWRIYTENFLVFLNVTVWLVIPTLLFGLLNFIDLRLGKAFLNYSVPIYLTLSAVSFVISLWVSIVLIRLIFSSIKQRSEDRHALMRNAWRDTPAYLWVTILMALASFIGALLLIVPGVIFTVWFFFAGAVFVLEGIRGSAALKASRQLVRRRFFPVLWRIVVPYVIFFALLVLVIGIPASIWSYFSGTALQQNGQLNWVADLWSRLIIILTLPLTKGFTVILYNDLKEA